MNYSELRNNPPYNSNTGDVTVIDFPLVRNTGGNSQYVTAIDLIQFGQITDFLGNAGPIEGWIQILNAIDTSFNQLNLTIEGLSQRLDDLEARVDGYHPAQKDTPNLVVTVPQSTINYGSYMDITITSTPSGEITLVTSSGSYWTAEVRSTNSTSHTIRITNAKSTVGDASITAGDIKINFTPGSDYSYTYDNVNNYPINNSSITLKGKELIQSSLAIDANTPVPSSIGNERDYTINLNSNTAGKIQLIGTYSTNDWVATVTSGSNTNRHSIKIENNKSTPGNGSISAQTIKVKFTPTDTNSYSIISTFTINSSAITLVGGEEISYYWYVGQTQPTSQSSITAQDSGTFTNNNWHTINVNNTYTFANPIYNSESNPISGDSNTNWYVALPADKSYGIYDSDDVNEVTAGNITQESSMITVNGVSYKVYKTVGTYRKFNGWWIH